MEIFKLFGSIFVDNDKANKSIDDTNKKGKDTEGTFSKMIGTAAKVGAGILAGATIAGGAMIALATKTGNAADRLLDLKDITGMTTDEIQRWERVAKIAGVNTDAMTNASQKLTKSLNAMDSEGNKSRKAVEALGLSFKDIENMNADQRMDVLAKALSGVVDPTERAKIGTDLFGGSWKEIAPIVGLGAEAMDKAKASANIISEDDLQKANNFRISMALMKDQVSFFAMELAIRLLPVAEKVFEWFEFAMPTIMKIFDFAMTSIGAGIEWLIEWIGKLIEWGRNWYENNKETVDSIVEGFTEFVDIVIELIQSFIGMFIVFWEKYGEDIQVIIAKYWEYIKAVFQLAFDFISGIFKIFTKIFKGDWEGAWEEVKNLASDIWAGIERLVETALDTIIEIIKGFGKLMFDAGKGLFNMLWDGIKSIWESISSWVSEKVSWIADKVMFWKKSSNEMADGEGSSGGKDYSGLAGLANGGTTLTPGRVLVGERGPEELHLPAGASVVPLGYKEDVNQNKTTQINQHITINSPSPLTPSEVARKTKQASKQLAMEWGM